MGNWLTIGVRHGAISADRWRRVQGESLIEVAVTNGALCWQWHALRWGVILEIGFADEAARDGFRILPAVTAALDAVPDPVNVSWSSQAAVAGRERGGHADPRPAATAEGSRGGRASRPAP